MAIYGKPNLPHENLFRFELFEISNHHAQHHYHKQVTIWCLPCGGHHIPLHICFIAGVIGCSPPFGVPCSWEFFFFLPKKIASKLVSLSILSCSFALFH